MFKIYEFKTEYQVNPIGLGCESPKFSWQIKSEKSFKQSAYRLLVASDAEMLKNNTADLYDSNIIYSGNTQAIQYGGKPLQSRQKCYVKVISYENEESVSSDINFFEMGLLKESDWQGNWMSMPVNNQGGTSLYRKALEVSDKKIVNAKAYVCGIGYHEAFINGKKLSDSVLNPGVTDYSKRLLYCTYDIMPLLTVGKNVFGIELGQGWYGCKKVLAQVYIDYADGTTADYHSSTNGGWWVGGSPTIDNSVYGGEVYDARLEETWRKDWATTSYEPAWDNGWMFTIFSAPPGGKLEPQTIEPIEVCGELKAVSMREIKPKTFIVDFGTNISGWARIVVEGKSGSSITLKFGERLTESGYVNQLNLRSARASDTYILLGKGKEEYAPRFTYHGFQYAQLEVTGECKILSIVAEHVRTATKTVGSFECSDAHLNLLHANALVTEQNNQHSILTDCPQRDERFGWLNDLGSRLFQTMYNCDMSRFFPKFIKDISDTQLASGAIGDTAPYFTGGRPADPVCIAYLLMPLYSYIYYGDSGSAISEYENLKKWVDFLISQSDDYIMNYSYYADWVAPTCFDEHTDNIYVSTLYLYWHCDIMSRLAKIAKNEDDGEKYNFIAQKVKAALNEKYFNKETCNYESGTQAANAMALSLGIVDSAYSSRVAKNINDDVVKKNYHSSCGNIGYRHLFYMLCEQGNTETALKILRNPDYPGWGFMIANGATSVWERWESEMSNEMDSFNHPMFGSYDAIFYHYLAGIKIDGDAFACDKITIEPIATESLSYVNCSYQTVRGTIVSNWKKEGLKITHSIQVPQTVSAKIVIMGKTYNVGGGKYNFEDGILKRLH